MFNVIKDEDTNEVLSTHDTWELAVRAAESVIEEYKNSGSYVRKLTDGFIIGTIATWYIDPPRTANFFIMIRENQSR